MRNSVSKWNSIFISKINNSANYISFFFNSTNQKIAMIKIAKSAFI